MKKSQNEEKKGHETMRHAFTKSGLLNHFLLKSNNFNINYRNCIACGLDLVPHMNL